MTKIIFNSTSSAIHDGGKNIFNYECSKLLIENFIEFAVRMRTKYNILSNTIARGFIKTKTKSEIKSRIDLIKLGKPGTLSDIFCS